MQEKFDNIRFEIEFSRRLVDNLKTAFPNFDEYDISMLFGCISLSKYEATKLNEGMLNAPNKS